MRGRFVGAVAVALVLALGAAGAASATELVFANIMEETIQISLDGQADTPVPGRSKVIVELPEGSHTVKVTRADGTVVNKALELAEVDAAATQGGRWWCSGVGMPTGKTTAIVILMDSQSCKEFIDAGVGGGG